MKKKKTTTDLAVNRKAFRDFSITETLETGIVLVGTEVKSLKDHGGSLQQAYVKVLEGELWLIGAHIATYSHGNLFNHAETRTRKLLVHRREREKLENWTREKGRSLLPLAFYLKQGKIKLKIGLGTGKKLFDKRQATKERDENRRMQSALKIRHG